METLSEKEPVKNIFICQGANWTCEIEVDLHNSQFDFIRQSEECATRAIEQFAGQEKGLQIKLNPGEETPELGGVLLCYLKGTPQENGFLLFVHELLANAGYYKQSFAVEQQTREELRKTMEAEAALLEEQKKLSESPKVKKPRKYKRKPKKDS